MSRRNFLIGIALMLLSSILLTRLLKPFDAPMAKLKRLSKVWPEILEGPQKKPYKSRELVFNEVNFSKIDESRPILPESDLFYRRVFRAEISCPQFVRAGDVQAGGWDVCTAGPFTLKPRCLVYSFGISEDWSFDDYLAQNHGCIVRSFDPSIGKVDHQRDEHQWFYNLGLGGSNRQKGSWQLRTFGTLLKQFGEEQATVDYLKFDIESSEYEALDAMFKEGSLERVKQIGTEFHMQTHNQKLVLKVLPMLRKLGFRSWSYHENALCRRPSKGRTGTSCAEVCYINTRFIKSQAYLEHDESETPLINKYHDKDPARGFVFFDLPTLPEPTISNAIEVLNSMVQQREVKCPQHKEVGQFEGRWDICLGSPFRPAAPCLVYSFFEGPFRWHWTFEDGMVNVYRCRIHSFVSTGLDIAYNRSEFIVSHKEGLGEETSESSSRKPFDSLLKLNGDELKTIDILIIGPHKNAERVLKNLLQSAGLARVKQLLIQLTPTTNNSTAALSQISILQTIKGQGFRRWAAPPEDSKTKPGSPRRLSYLNNKLFG